MSKVKYKKARSTISMLPSDLMDEESDDDIPSAMEAPIQASQPLSTTSPTEPQFSTALQLIPLLTIYLQAVSAPSISEQYQPPPHMWTNVPPRSSVWGSQSMEYMEQYHQQPFQHPHHQMPPLPRQQMIPPPQQPAPQPPQQTEQQRTTTPNPLSDSFGSAAQVLRDQPRPTQGSPGKFFDHSLPNISTLSNLSGFRDIMGSPPDLVSQDGELNTTTTRKVLTL